jgi:DNA-binding NarL/FixJ family response regulator
MTGRITCLVADDHPAVLDSVTRFLAKQGIRIVGKAQSGDEAVAQIGETRPQVAVLDLHMPGMSGIDVAAEVAASSPDTAVIVYTGFADRDRLSEAIRSGIRGFIVKDAPLPELTRAISMVADGLPYVDPTLAPSLVREGLAQPAERLTDREREVMRLLADGLTTEGIGQTLAISGETAQTHISTAMRKLGADTRTQAVATALRRCQIS